MPLSRGVLVALYVLCCSMLLPAIGAQSARAQTPGAAERPQLAFSHQTHVRAEWFQPGKDGKPGKEYRRDCRGCHDFDQPAAARTSPADTCIRCHWQQEPQLSGIAPPVPDQQTTSAFDHFDHRAQHCNECHAPTAETRNAGRMPVPIAAAATFCAGCHSEGERRRQFDATLTARLKARPTELVGTFLHAEHLGPQGLADANTCATCHGGLAQEAWGTFAPNQFDVAACAKCHPGTKYTTTTRREASAVAATFAHGSHLTAGSPQTANTSRTAIDQQGCFACHRFDPGTDTFGLRPAYGVTSGTDAAKACYECHQDWQNDSHGKVDDCRSCHRLDSEEWPHRRPVAAVPERPPTTFRATAQSHPMITGGSRPESCRECHLSDLPALPSRIQGQPFRHHSHLDPTQALDAKVCLECHPSIAASDGPQGSGPAHSDAACSKCHQGADLRADPRAVSSGTTRDATVFSHRAHLADRHGKPSALACASCHALGDSRGADLTLIPGVADCTACHGHDGQRAANSGHGAAEVAACRNCHRPGVPLAPAPGVAGAAVQVDRLRLLGAEGQRVHPQGGTCAECHQAPLATGVTNRGKPPIGVVMSRQHAHEGVDAVKLGIFYQEVAQPAHPQWPAGRKTWCIDCHWALPKKLESQLAWVESQEWFKNNRSQPQWREAYGDRLEGLLGVDPKQLQKLLGR